MTVAKQTRVWLFFGLAMSINIIDPMLVRAITKPPVAIAAAFDLAVVVPALYFWLVVRSGIQPLTTMIPLCLLALFRATWIMPGLSMTRPLLAGGVEIAVVALIVTRTRRRLVTAIAADEIAVLYYAFAAWRRKPEVPPGMEAYSTHQRAGTAVLFGSLAAISVVEAPLLHLLVMRWNVKAAWVLTVLSVYGAIWLVGMARAFVLRPVLVGNGELVIRSGLLWTLHAPLDRIASIHRGGGASDLRLCPGGDPNVAMEFSEPMIAAGMFGRRRRVTRVALSIDDPPAFERALTTAR
jgi:hypothetical protein